MSFFETNWKIYTTSIKNSYAYRFSMILSIISGPLFMLTYYMIWKAVFAVSGKTTIGGLDFPHMIIYIVLSFTTLYLTWDEIDQTMIMHVHRGSLTPFLLRPLSFMRFEFVNKIGHRTLAFFIEFIPVVIIMGLFLGFDIYKTTTIVWYILALVLAFIISFFIRFLLGMLAFWFVRPRGLIWMYRMFSSFLNGIFLPLSFFPLSVQKAFVFMPFQFVAYVPAKLFMGTYELGGLTFQPWTILLIGLGQTILLYLLVLWAWHISLKRFCGSGT